MNSDVSTVIYRLSEAEGKLYGLMSALTELRALLRESGDKLPEHIAETLALEGYYFAAAVLELKLRASSQAGLIKRELRRAEEDTEC